MQQEVPNQSVLAAKCIRPRLLTRHMRRRGPDEADMQGS